MKKLVVPLLAISFAGAVFSASTAEANDSGKPAINNSQRNCRKVTVAAMSKTATPAVPRDAESIFDNDFYNQHPSGGG